MQLIIKTCPSSSFAEIRICKFITPLCDSGLSWKICMYISRYLITSSTPASGIGFINLLKNNMLVSRNFQFKNFIKQIPVSMPFETRALVSLYPRVVVVIALIDIYTTRDNLNDRLQSRLYDKHQLLYFFNLTVTILFIVFIV